MWKIEAWHRPLPRTLQKTTLECTATVWDDSTAVTEAGEFWEIYKLDVWEYLPTNRPIARDEDGTLIYKTKTREVTMAIIDE